jgi:multidrug efflux pump subunit AcrA (membrane-fusion protein)
MTDLRARMIRWRAPRRLAVLGVVVVAIVVGLAAVVLAQGGAEPTATGSTATVQRGAVTVAVAASGTVTAAQTRGLSFSMSGTVTELNVKAGELVTEGQVLARIDDAEAQDAVDEAESRLSDAEEAVDRAEATASLPVCATATPTPSAGGDRPGAGPTATQQNCVQPGRSSTNDSLLSAQQQRNNAKLALERARARLAGTVITAPLAGRVLSVDGRVGGVANPGGTGFIVIGDVTTVSVRAEFSEADVGRITVGQVASVLLADRDDPLPAKVSQIDPAGTTSDRLVRYGVVVTFDAAPADLLLGQSADVTITTDEATDVLFVMSVAVTGVVDSAGAATGTVTVRADGRDEARSVRLGLRGDQYTEVADGLAEGEVVVLPTVS